MRPATVPLSFKLPFYWERQKAPRGYAFYSRSDDLTAALAVVQMPGKVTSGTELANSSADLIGAIYGRADPSAQIQVSRVVLPIGVSIRAVVTFNQGVAIVYFLSRGSHGYAFMFHTGQRALPSWEPEFRRTAKSIRFVGSSL